MSVEDKLKDLTITEKKSGCGCGCSHSVETMEAAPIPHFVRHAAIIGALKGMKVGDKLLIIFPHDPQPLLREIDAIEDLHWERSYQAKAQEHVDILFSRTM